MSEDVLRERTYKRHRLILLVVNVLLMAVAIAASLSYANAMRNSQIESRKSDFLTTVDSMKAVSLNYLDSERGYVSNWVSYIDAAGMTLDEALDYLRTTNTNKNRFAHIVDMRDFRAWSSFYDPGQEETDIYQRFNAEGASDWERYMRQCMLDIFNGAGAESAVLGRYQVNETFSVAVSVGERVSLVREDGSVGEYLLLRVIPVEDLSRSWVFPAEYKSAEVGIITDLGDYVIQSPSMKGRSFYDYIRSYNFPDDYNKGDEISQQLAAEDTGVMFYKDYRGDERIWYHSAFGGGLNISILGSMKMSELESTSDSWLIVGIICGTLFVLFAVDGVALLRMNAKLRDAAESASRASKAKTQFLSAMSHDIRTPMNAVLGMMSIMRRDIDDPARVAECLDKAEAAGQQLMTLINDVLDISKVESGHYTLTPVEVDVRELLQDQAKTLSPLIAKKDLGFSVNTEGLSHSHVMADPLRLSQVFMNLLSNAMKYTEPGGWVRVTLSEEGAGTGSGAAKPADAGAAKPADAGAALAEPATARLVFRVEDTGIGMSAEFQKDMYTLFSREIETQVNRTQGSGLGLYIVAQMVELMGGTIECQSAPGEGTTFTVRLELPVAEEPAEEASTEGESAGDVSGLKLLVAEDNELNWEIAQVLLEDRGVSCQRAKNGAECVEMLSAAAPGTYDAVLMDIQMPQMNGLEAARVIRGLPAEKNGQIVIIAMTADAFADDIEACLEAGMNGHIAKPINLDQLDRYLRRIKNKTI